LLLVIVANAINDAKAAKALRHWSPSRFDSSLNPLARKAPNKYDTL